MADSRRSSRSKKQVDYSKFGGTEDTVELEDDDFVSFTPPVSKPAKTKKPTSKKEKAGKSDGKAAKEESKKKKQKTERMSIDDKIYERELQMALELSQEGTAAGDEEPPHLEPEIPISDPPENLKDFATVPEGGDTGENDNNKENDAKDDTDHENSTTEKQSMIEEKTEHFNVRDDRESSPEIAVMKKQPKNKGTKRKKVEDDPDEILVLEKNVEEFAGGRGKRRAASKAVKRFVDSDSEDDEDDDGADSDDSFHAPGFDDGPSSDSDSVGDEENEDEDFNAAPKSKKKGKGPVKAAGSAKAPAKPKPKPRSKMSATVKPVNTNIGRAQGLGKSIASKPGLGKSVTPKPSSALSSLNNKTPSRSGPLQISKSKWVPPGAAGTSRSPSGELRSPGTIRIGLSKKARIKPLHSPQVNA